MNLSILDIGLNSDKYKINGLVKTIELVKFCEEINCNRYWLAEHYDQFQDWHQVESVITILAGITSKIRIGAGGVLIKHRSVFLTMSNFILMNTLFSNRIDLGIAGGGVAKEFQKKVDTKQDYIEQMSLISKYTKKPFLKKSGIIYDSVPEIWCLGSGGVSFQTSLKNRFNYCFSTFHNVSNYKNKKMKIISKIRGVPNLNMAIAIAGISTKKHLLETKIFIDRTGINGLVYDDGSKFLQKIDSIIKEFNPSELFYLPISNDISECKRNIQLVKKLIENYL